MAYNVTMDFIIGKRINSTHLRSKIWLIHFGDRCYIYHSLFVLHCVFFSLLSYANGQFPYFPFNKFYSFYELIAIMAERGGENVVDPLYFDIVIFIEVHFSMPCAKFRMFEDKNWFVYLWVVLSSGEEKKIDAAMRIREKKIDWTMTSEVTTHKNYYVCTLCQ